MQDLNIITKLNNEATERDIPNQLAAGKYVAAQYTGLHFTGYTSHDTESECNAAAAAHVNAGPSNRSQIHRPA
ncbi:hypothetical protein UFOVP61_18 [uncultured Caudovirales phage]|uniref:Uncharacterized protein n=1 Tax=uncultured Caudovirales phage TaxID=2100421 RepID=A0A6J5KWD6_9CAUD|nr:hypothetical protein UFOVP61_18 [uncultured Caudovirales phage]